MDGVGDNNDSRYIFFDANLINSISNHKKFHFSTSNVGHMINHLVYGYARPMWLCHS